MKFGKRNQKLADELIKMFWQDQKAASDLQVALNQPDAIIQELILEHLKLNYRQTERIKQIVAEYGKSLSRAYQ